MAARGAVLGVVASLCAALTACVPAQPVATVPRPLSEMEVALHSHVAVLASDEFAGREVESIGEGLTLDYLQAEFAAAGLKSGTHDPGNAWREPFSYEHQGRTIRTHNLIARLPGAEPQAGAVLLIAHWDHLGYGARCKRAGDDKVCNGAVDNASGLAMMIEIARALAKGPQPERDIYFLASGGEEDGLRGALSFVADPPVPLEKFVAVFNLDTEGVAPPGAPVVVLATPGPATVGALMSLVSATARDEGVTLVPPDEGNRKYLKRQDGWAFDAEGIPAVIISAAFAQQNRLRDYMRHRYHRANDDVAGVELGAAADMVGFHVALLQRAANPAMLPRAVTAAAGRTAITANAP
ncbi:M20/M25/M40 family metallo-hydrolase [Croceicoccus ponticola]|uniref:M20/M25/M40 family metallo-hydrolase n=1 Tax=Croceicoccus ponticola TaxID=2217664 RepID=A0A437H1E3_9SPHN|nr:M20/M25/M40 family metallo-hydrolase [Croceicoccus ponticola]RVQ69464.1 M20/M25/M40 family metallo-hydrolase [Croceicoccus ponticola]